MEIEKGNTQSAQEDIYCTDLKDIHIDLNSATLL